MRWSRLSIQLVLAAACVVALPASTACAQDLELPPPEVDDSDTGYIDNAIVGTQVRFRFDAAYGSDAPDRAEFFYGKCGCFRLVGDRNAPGPLPIINESSGLVDTSSRLIETSVDYQEIRMDLEYAFNNRFSVFAELPFRFINPGFSANAAGLGDVRAGFK